MKKKETILCYFQITPDNKLAASIFAYWCQLKSIDFIICYNENHLVEYKKNYPDVKFINFVVFGLEQEVPKWDFKKATGFQVFKTSKKVKKSSGIEYIGSESISWFKHLFKEESLPEIVKIITAGMTRNKFIKYDLSNVVSPVMAGLLQIPDPLPFALLSDIYNKQLLDNGIAALDKQMKEDKMKETIKAEIENKNNK